MSLMTAGTDCTVSQHLLRCGGKLFHCPGPAATKALSPKVLWVRITTHVRLSVFIFIDIRCLIINFIWLIDWFFDCIALQMCDAKVVCGIMAVVADKPVRCCQWFRLLCAVLRCRCSAESCRHPFVCNCTNWSHAYRSAQFRSSALSPSWGSWIYD